MYGLDDSGCFSAEAKGACGKSFRRGGEDFKNYVSYKLRNGTQIKLWRDP